MNQYTMWYAQVIIVLEVLGGGDKNHNLQCNKNIQKVKIVIIQIVDNNNHTKSLIDTSNIIIENIIFRYPLRILQFCIFLIKENEQKSYC